MELRLFVLPKNDLKSHGLDSDFIQSSRKIGSTKDAPRDSGKGK